MVPLLKLLVAQLEGQVLKILQIVHFLHPYYLLQKHTELAESLVHIRKAVSHSQARQALGGDGDEYLGILSILKELEKLINRMLLNKHRLRRCHAATARQAVLQRYLGYFLAGLRVLGLFDEVGLLHLARPLINLHLKLVLQIVVAAHQEHGAACGVLFPRILFFVFRGHDHFDAFLARCEEIVEVC